MNEMFIETRSPWSFGESVDRLQQAIDKAGWKTPAVHDLQQTMKNFGIEVRAVKVFEICHPKHSSRILERDDERIVSSLMPCRISVYEKSDGSVIVSRMNTGMMAASMGGLIAEVMSGATADVEEIVKNFLASE